ncbi:MAG: DUF3015 family protein [Gammaproteobacteria bacterium]
MKPRTPLTQISVTLLAASAIMLGGCTITDITSSTSGTLDAVTPDITLNRFVDTRIASIQQEAAGGEGENLEALAYLLGRQDKDEFSGWMQLHYDELFTGLGQPGELISRIEAVESRARI